ncbi:MAG: Chromate resistance exported protein [Methanomassiliicoccales archaeon PtaU1.Bin124]|nr:MAG: Chromate resistance exported protein [Methanomassiliicoccales archaeon PtaU1.Bin124]
MDEVDGLKWITKEGVDADGAACAWLIRRFIDEAAEFHFSPADTYTTEMERLNAVPFNVEGVRYGPKDGRSSFDSFLEWYGIRELAMLRLADMIRAVRFDALPKNQAARDLKGKVDEIVTAVKDDRARVERLSKVFDGVLERLGG